MPRPLKREKPLSRVNVMLDCEALEKAQRKAALAGVAPSIIGSNSAFIRWLVDNYKMDGDVVIDGNEYYSPRKACDVFAIHRNTLDSLAVEAMKGESDIPILFVRQPVKNKDGIPFRHRSPEYYLPCEEFGEWIVTPRKSKK